MSARDEFLKVRNELAPRELFVNQRGAWAKGYLAAKSGRARTNPYDNSNVGGYLQAWFDGYDAQVRGLASGS